MFLLLLCSHIVATTEVDALGVANQGIPFDEKYGSTFVERVHEVIFVMVPKVEEDFKRQLRQGFSSQEEFRQLLLQLPFEPDNLGTGDCTFNACCSVLMLGDVYKRIETESI